MAERKSGFGIIGLGKFGLALTEALAAAGKDVLVIDEYEENLHLVRDVAPEAYLVGKITKEALEETGITNCETVIVCITKVEVSVMYFRYNGSYYTIIVHFCQHKLSL